MDLTLRTRTSLYGAQGALRLDAALKTRIAQQESLRWTNHPPNGKKYKRSKKGIVMVTQKDKEEKRIKRRDKNWVLQQLWHLLESNLAL